MPLTSLVRDASKIRAYMGHVWIWNYSNNSWVSCGAVRAPSVQIEPVLRDPDSEGRQVVTSYDITVKFTILDMTNTLRTILGSSNTRATVFFGKSASVSRPTYNSSTQTFTGNPNGFLFVNVWLSVNAQISFAGEGDAYECTITVRALPADAAAIFDGSENKIVLP